MNSRQTDAGTTSLRLVLLLAAVFTCGTAGSLAASIRQSDGKDLMLWYRQPAQEWTEALPIGNGRLGAMVFGDAEQERLQLNEDTLYAGEPGPVGVVPIHRYVDGVFNLIGQGNY